MGLIIDVREIWRPAVADALAASVRVLSFLRKIGSQTWRGLQGFHLLFYSGEAVSRCLYALPLLSILPAQLDTLETFQRMTLRICLRSLKYAGNVVSLVEAKDSPFFLQVDARAFVHIESVHRTPLASYLLHRFLGLRRTHVVRLATKSCNIIGPHSLLRPDGLPRASCIFLKIHIDIPDLKRKSVL